MREYNNLSDDEILEVVREYLKDSIYNYAILIDGDWGSGKSYFIKQNLIPEIEKDYFGDKVLDKKEFIYISLYGVKSTEDISNQIYINLLNNKVRVGNTVKKVVSTGAKVFGDIIKLTGIDIKEYKSDMESFIDLNKYILVFDDLERCNCDVNEVLGYINNFVEHDGIKVILVANEKEIGKSYECKNLELRYLLASEGNIAIDDKDNKFKENTKLSLTELNTESKDEVKKEVEISIDELKRRAKIIFDEDTIYKKVKEKLIGITIKYEPSLEEIQKKLISEYVNDSDLKSYLEKCIKDNIQYAYEKKHINLRTYQFFLSRIINIYNKIIEEKYINLDEVMPSIVNYCYKICIDYKCGEYEYKWNESVAYNYNRLNYYNNDKCEFEYKFIDDFIISSKLNKDEVVNDIKLSLKEKEEFEKNSTDALYKLEEWWELEDKNAEEYMKTCIDNLKSDIYPDSLFSKILSIFIYLESIGFDKSYLYDIVKCLESKLNTHNIHKMDLCYYMDTYEKISIKYNEIVEELKNKVEKNCRINIVENINKCIEYKDDWGKKLYDFVITNPDYIDTGKSFMEIIELEKLKENIEESNSYNLSYFRYIISQFYTDYRIINNCRNDKDKIEELIKFLKESDKTNFDKITNNNIKLLIKVLEEKCKLFEI